MTSLKHLSAAFWATVVVVVVLVGYPLSFGPACWLTKSGCTTPNDVKSFYLPIWKSYRHLPKPSPRCDFVVGIRRRDIASGILLVRRAWLNVPPASRHLSRAALFSTLPESAHEVGSFGKEPHYLRASDFAKHHLLDYDQRLPRCITTQVLNQGADSMSHGFLHPLVNMSALAALSAVCSAAIAILACGKLAAAEGRVPTIEEHVASPLGMTGLTANGRIYPHKLPTNYHFEYGPTVAYGSQTTAQPLPPRLAAFYRESWDRGLAGWSGGMDGKGLVHLAEGGASQGFVRFTEPSGNDPNHVDGIGTLHLASYFYPATHPSGAGVQAYWGGGDPDLRDARVKIQVRGNKWVPNGSECVWWNTKRQRIALKPHSSLAKGQLGLHRFQPQRFPRLWQVGKGRVPAEEQLPRLDLRSKQSGPGPAQLRLCPINDSLGRLSCDFFHLLAFVDPQKPPEGSIDFDEFELAYRNYSLLLPSNGGKLLSSPADSPDDVATLTDGWRNGAGRMWRSAPQPTAPLEFTYAFADPVTIQTIQIHQHSDWPSRQVEVLVSDDGESWKPLLKKELPENSPAGPNFTFLLERGISAAARQVQVRILSGYKPERWGLGEIEIFGTGAVMQTDDDWYYVNQDITGLESGKTYHFRLIATSSAGTTHGADQAFTLPADSRPHVVTGLATRIRNGSARVEGRLNPLGKKTEFYFEYGPDTNYGQKTSPQYGGLQITPRARLMPRSAD